MWRFHRRNIHSGIRHIESSNENLSSKVISETKKLFDILDSAGNTPIDLSGSLRSLSSRMVCFVSFGRRFDSFADSKSFADFLAGVKCISTQLSVFSLAFVFPPLYDTFLYDEIRAALQHIKTFLSDMLSEHKRTFQKGIIGDVMDAYCDVILSKGSSKTEIEEKDIWNTFFDLLGAGSDTSANTLLWGVMYMCGHPEYQERVSIWLKVI